MQDIQNIPNPDVNSIANDEDLDNHSDVGPNSRTDRDSQDFDIERPEEDIPSHDNDRRNVPIEEPPSETEKAPIDEDNTERERLV
jgi:hypothetical protein